jgi:hypothetical protein
VTAQTTTLYRPVGQGELELIRASRFREFPPRLPEQPNTKDERSGFVGYVLRFRVRTEFLGKCDVHTVGSSDHREYWIPADSLKELNANLVGEIEEGGGEVRTGTNENSGNN